MKVYYAHSLHLYNTIQESRDLKTLSTLGLEIVNPNTQETQAAVDQAKIDNPETYMEVVFKPLVTSCEILAFRSHIDGSISSGVAKEIRMAMEAGMEIIELPNLFERREMSKADTRLALQYLGHR